MILFIIVLSLLGGMEKISPIQVGSTILIFSFVLLFLEVRGNTNKLSYHRLLINEYSDVFAEHRAIMEKRLETGYRYTDIEIKDGINTIQKIESSLKCSLLIN